MFLKGVAPWNYTRSIERDFCQVSSRRFKKLALFRPVAQVETVFLTFSTENGKFMDRTECMKQAIPESTRIFSDKC